MNIDVRDSQNATSHFAPLVSVIIPTFNEVANVSRIAAAVGIALEGTDHEIVFVDDDSLDGTRAEIAKLAATVPGIRLIHRIGRRGLSTAVTEGMLSTTAPFMVVIDADLQHDESIIPEMLSFLEANTADLVVGSRYVEGGGLGSWDKRRAQISAFATWLAKVVTKNDLSDPMSGFFAITRPAFDNSVRDLSGQGYKILLDICASAKSPLRIREVAYQFRTRQAGESKLDALVTWEYLMLLADKLVGHVIPARFISFSLIGGLGVLVHMAVLSVLLATGLADFFAAQGLATFTAMVFNFFVNNTLTYRDRRLRGVREVIYGLFSFMLVCSVGAFANVGIANYLFANSHYRWWSAGLAGILLGAVWNYAATSVFTWRVRKRSSDPVNASGV
ncbi:MAG: glycosyltransferase family 2 protein [Mesorhizobium sp.]|uniref:glycosyltransferase n=1 Tax=Mesorhizobium sp. TaxID=1871066 RepID=UPI001AD3CE26|nr:glycosyltransferase family 2 protein [Mesorhizobium sp.]MBN9219246.1 glycosyltransferase family 2 protein [Mesorhizobium sp.]